MPTPEEDYDWCLQQPGIRQRYAGQVLVVHHRTILGSGEHHREALDNAKRLAAEAGHPFPDRDLLFVVVPELIWFDPDFIGEPLKERGVS